MAAKQLTDKEQEILKVLMDPVLWAEATLRDPGNPDIYVKLRDYQKHMLRDPKLRKVSRCGRRIGKTFTMCIHMLWYAFTHRNRPQIVATPYETQVTLIFDTLKTFIDTSPELKDSIANITKNPHRIEFRNGCTIKGFTAGTKSGAEGGSLRGQAGDWIYMDEVDYMTDGDFETIYAIALAKPKEIGVWISSTPTGRRGMFWKVCTDKKLGWSEHYYPTMVNPDWDATMERELRGMFSEVAYEHEVLANFGEETVGVFKKEFIDRARHKYNYINLPMYRAVRVLGVDWDKYGDASQMVLMEYNSEAGKFQVINRFEIPKGEFTLDNGVNKIIEINEIYSPNAIYVDRGYGEYQVETLHKYGMDNPDTGLDKKVVGISFAQAKDIIDPFTKIMQSKPIKPFMVSQLQILFERDRIMISDYDEMIIRQLENYQMLKKTVNGVPVFTNEDEHTIDCMMLAVLGFIEKFPNMAATIVEYKPATKILRIETTAKNIMQELVDKDKDELFNAKKNYLWDEPGPPPPRKVEPGTKPKDTRTASFGWATRGTNIYKEHKRSSW